MTLEKKVTLETETKVMTNTEILLACGIQPSDSQLLRAINESYTKAHQTEGPIPRHPEIRKAYIMRHSKRTSELETNGYTIKEEKTNYKFPENKEE